MPFDWEDVIIPALITAFIAAVIFGVFMAFRSSQQEARELENLRSQYIEICVKDQVAAGRERQDAFQRCVVQWEVEVIMKRQKDRIVPMPVVVPIR